MHNNPSASAQHTPKAKTLNSKTNRIRRTRRSRRRRNSKQFGQTSNLHNHLTSDHLLTHQFSYSINPKSFDLWRKTYENILRWHSEHQINYWRNQAQHFRNINHELWTKLQKYEDNQSKSNEDKIPEYETSSSEEDDEKNNDQMNNKSKVDEEYLNFLEITQKHQNERDRLRGETVNKKNSLDKI